MEMDDSKKKEFEEAGKILDDTPAPLPSDRMDRRFYDSLDAAIATNERAHRNPATHPTWWAMAAGIVLFISGWIGGSLLATRHGKSTEVMQLSGEVRDLRESLAFTMIQQPLPGKRIQAINMLADMERVDDKMIETLLSTLNHDPNDNVRLVALETLANHTENATVMEGMIQAIGQQQTSPVVLLRLTELMSILREKRAMPALKQLIEKPDLNYNLKTQINETIQGLS